MAFAFADNAQTAPSTVGMAVPGAPSIQNIRGENYPDTTAEPKRKVAFLEQCVKDGETDALARFRQGTHHLLYAEGRQWIAWESVKKTFEDLPNGQYEMRVTNNYIKPILRARAARMLSGQVQWRVIPRSNAYEERDQAEVGRCLVQHRWTALEMHAKIRRGLMQAYCTGVVALKSFWNPQIGPKQTATTQLPVPEIVPDPATGQPVETGMTNYEEVPVDADGMPVEDPSQAFQYRPGDTDTALRSIFNLRLNPEAHGWTSAEGFRWLVDSEVVTLAVAREKFPQIAEQITAAEGTESAFSFEKIAMGAQLPRQQGSMGMLAQAHKAQSQPESELTTIREYWEDRSSFFPDGRLIVAVGGALAYDGAWPQGIFPYAPLFDELAPMSPYGRATVTDLVSPQNVINREWSATVQELSSSGLSQFVAWDVPGVPDQITSENRAVIRIPMRTALGGRTIKDVFTRLEPAMVSPDRWRMIEQAKITMFDIGAYHEITRGQIPPGLDSGVAIQALQESEAGQLKEAVDALKRTLLTWAKHQLALAQWGYGPNEQRWIPVERPDLGFMVEGVNGLQLPDPDNLDFELEYFRPQSEAAMRAEVKELLQLGFLDPRLALKALDLGRGVDAAFATQTRHYARARSENLAFERGQIQLVPGQPQVDPMTGAVVMGPPSMVKVDPQTGEVTPVHLPGHDDDLIHIEVHQEIGLDESKPWPVRQLILQHLEEHMAVIQAQMAAQQQAQSQDAGGGPPSDGGGNSPPQ